nr:MAG TPA: hypothetical protein [Caudoviricetes sp.]
MYTTQLKPKHVLTFVKTQAWYTLFSNHYTLNTNN